MGCLVGNGRVGCPEREAVPPPCRVARGRDSLLRVPSLWVALNDSQRYAEGLCCVINRLETFLLKYGLLSLSLFLSHSLALSTLSIKYPVIYLFILWGLTVIKRTQG